MGTLVRRVEFTSLKMSIDFCLLLLFLLLSLLLSGKGGGKREKGQGGSKM